MIPIILFFPAIAAYAGFFDDIGKQLKEEASKLIKDKTQSTDSTTPKKTQSTDSTTSKKSEDNSNTSPAKTNDGKVNNKPDSKQATKAKSSDGAAAFRQLPEEIQNKILDEATKARQECVMGSLVRWFYNCDCVKEEFIKARTIQGPKTSFYRMTQDVRKKCVSPESITQYYYLKCAGPGEINLRDFETYCKCYSETMTNKFVARPYLSQDFLGLLHKETYKECRYTDYLKPRSTK